MLQLLTQQAVIPIAGEYIPQLNSVVMDTFFINREKLHENVDPSENEICYQ